MIFNSLLPWQNFFDAESRFCVLNILDKINSPADVKALKPEELPALCQELRAFLLEHVSRTGGHLASNLGAVELTVALHRVYDTEKDRLVFDVGHQSYVHKILTGRKERFDSLRQLDGLSGFPKPRESVHDAFIAGHASNSVSVALGMARARSATGADYDVVALLGDGALTGGLSYEGLSDAGQSGEPMVVILNDNGMSIGKNVGGMARLLSRLRVRPGYLQLKRAYRDALKGAPGLYDFIHRVKERAKRLILPDNVFDDLGFYYLGPVDGHDVAQLEATLRWAKDSGESVLLHVLTAKGKGYAFAEQNPDRYHGVSPFDPEVGLPENKGEDFSAAFGSALYRLAREDRKVCGITAAMAAGTGLATLAQRLPRQFFDVGIAEGHAVAMAAGMAKEGARPVFAVYSSFLQRGYDMLIHDVALQGLHVVFGVDRAGLVGGDGETHTGAFDVDYLSSVPNMAVLCPSSYAEVQEMLEMALYRFQGPVAIRYPRGQEGAWRGSTAERASARLRRGWDVTIVTYGILINEALAAAELLSEQGITAEVWKLNLIAPLDAGPVLRSLEETQRLVVAEEACAHGCVGEAILAAAAQKGIALQGSRLLNLGSGIIPQGKVEELRRALELDAQGIAAAAGALVNEVEHEKSPVGPVGV